jgi:ATPase subunit of ABC transporter with duplicated ATPase domains
VVSHDRYLLERVTDHQMALLGDGKLRGLPGGVDQYLELREATLAGSTVTGGGNPVTSGGQQGTAAAPSGPSEAEKREARKALNRIERQLKKLDQEEKKLHDQMVKTTEAGDFDALAAQNKQLKDLTDEKDALEMEWLESSELLGD